MVNKNNRLYLSSPGALPRGGLGCTYPSHFCQRVFLRLMQNLQIRWVFFGGVWGGSGLKFDSLHYINSCCLPTVLDLTAPLLVVNSLSVRLDVIFPVPRCVSRSLVRYVFAAWHQHIFARR